MEQDKAKKMWVLGIDGLIPKLAERFMGEGIMPNLAEMAGRGSRGKVLPVLPAFTPTNWTTVATGAAPGTHGIFLWGTHRVGDPFEQTYMEESMTSPLCEAEYLWDTAAKSGRKSVIMNFVGYPPTNDKVVFVDNLLHPAKCPAEIAKNAYYTTDPTDTSASEISIKPAAGWSSMPSSQHKPLETEIEVSTNSGAHSLTYQALIYSRSGKGYDRLLLSDSKDAARKFADVKAGEWTEWKFEQFLENGKSSCGTVRFKLTNLSADGKKLGLYRSQVCFAGKFAMPSALGKRLIERCGPYIGEGVGRSFFPNRWVDEATLKEEFAYQTNWIGNAAEFLMDETAAELFIMHWHYLDYLQHQFLGLIDPVGAYYDPVKAPEAWQAMRTGYIIADNIVGEFLKRAESADTVMVISDHGNIPNRKVLSIFNLLIENNLLALDVNKADSTISVDWSKTKAYCHGLHIYINLKGRDPNGIVTPGKEYQRLRNQLITLLRTYKDEDGEFPFEYVLKKEDAPLIGLWGEGIGDIVFCYSQGYAWMDEQSILDNEKRIVWTSGGANHGCQMPTAETEVSSNYGMMLISGPNVRKGYKRPAQQIGPISMKDIAPTIAHIMGIPAPMHSEGRVLQDVFDGYKPPRKKPVAHPFMKNKMALKLESDVTDKVL